MVIATRWFRERTPTLGHAGGEIAPRSLDICRYWIKRDDLVLGNAVELAIGSKAQTPGPTKFGQACRARRHERDVRSAASYSRNGRRGIRCAERVLARHDDVAVGCNRQIKRAEFRVADQPDGPRIRSPESKATTALSPTAIRADPGGEKKSSVVTERKSAGKRHDCRWQERLASDVK